MGDKGGTYCKCNGNCIVLDFEHRSWLNFAVYMLLDKERLMLQGKRILKAYASDEWVSRVSYVTRVAVQTFSNFL